MFLIGSCSIRILRHYAEVAQRCETISAAAQRREASCSFACFCAVVPYPYCSIMLKWRSVARPSLLRCSVAKHSVPLSASVALHSCSTLPKWRIVAEPLLFLIESCSPALLFHYDQVAQRGETHSVALPRCFSLHLPHSSFCIVLLCRHLFPLLIHFAPVSLPFCSTSLSTYVDRFNLVYIYIKT